jgi:hypothetical protein
LLFGFLVVRILGYAIDGADLDTLGFIEMANAFGAQVRIDDVNVIAL